MKDFKWLFETPIAHRGLHNENVSENSMTAFRLAIEKGYNIEIDVHLSSDGKLVVFHDFNLRRICGIDKKIVEMTYEELSKCKLRNTEDTIPTLLDLLKLIDGRVGLLIEIKFRMHKEYKNIAEQVYKAIKDYKGNVAVQSFSPVVVKWFKDNAPETTRGLLATGYQNLGMPEIVKKGMRLISRIVGLRVIRSIAPDFIAFNILSFPSRKMKMLRESGMPFLTWTVNKMNLLTEAKKYADNIIFERIDITEYKF